MKETRLRIMAGEPGFEPGLPGPEPGVLPLDYSPATDVTESKSRRFSEVVNDILPLHLPQKTRKIGQLIQSQLPNPPNTPIISPHPADNNVINAPIFYYFRHGTLFLCNFSLKGVAILSSSGTMEVGR